MSRRGNALVTALSAMAVADSARRARARSVGPSEERLFRLLNGCPDGCHPPVWMVMQSGSLASVFVVAGVLYHRQRRRSAVAAAIVGTAVWAGVKAVKPLVGRGRPADHLAGVSVRGLPQSGLGYPSGHAAVAMALALIATRGCGLTARTAAVTIAGVTGGARIYVGAHLPLDVAGGYAIGVLGGRAAEELLEGILGPSAGKGQL